MLNNLALINYFSIFGLKIYFYAIAIVCGFGLSALCAYPLLKRRGLNGDIIFDMLIAALIGGILFARIVYVILEFDSYVRPTFGATLLAMVDTRSGGLSIYGGVGGGALGLYIVSRIRKVPMGKLADIGATVLPLGQAIGRFGNFFNQEVYGIATEQAWWPYSIYIEKTGQYHLALCFYEMFLNLILFGLLYLFLYKYTGRRNLYSTSLYLIGYGIIRAVLEPLRMPKFQLKLFNTGLKAMVVVAIAMIILGLILAGIMLYKDITEKNYWWKDIFKKKVPEPTTEENKDA